MPKNRSINSRKIKNQLKCFISNYWDCLFKEGAYRTIIGYGFSIDTGNTTPAFCKNQVMDPMNHKPS